jgi:hypothetical protein
MMGSTTPIFLFLGGIVLSKISSIDAFKMGMKPAYLTTSESKDVENELLELKGYPCLDEGIEIADEGEFYLFFQNHSEMKSFLKETEGLSPKSKEFQMILGLTLGYPPKSVEYFGAKWDDESLGDYGVALTHAGSTAITHIDDLVEVAQWFWNTYPYAEDLEMGLVDMAKGWVRFSSPFKDQDALLELQQKGLEIMVY